jgi:tRNA-Thr(GGU) m(6)t(6)A37 methyltransferase TsaA
LIYENDTVTKPIVITPIGLVRSALRDRLDAPRQAFEGAPEAILEIDPILLPAVHRVTPGTEVIVVTWLHEADRSVLQVHPRDDERIPLTGVFATRSPDRPNPIGLHRVTVTHIEQGTRVHVDALEAIDGTPILDLKIAMSDAADA